MSRDLRIDTLRGLALVVITWHHLPFPVRSWGQGALGYFSFFEVFVFLSGLVAGMVYAGLATGRGTRALRRSGTIYLVHMGVLSCVVAMWALFEDGGRMNMRGDGLLERSGSLVAWLYALVLLYQPGLTNVLPLYVLFVPLTPVVVAAVERGRSALPLCISVAAWAFSQTEQAAAIWRTVEASLGHSVNEMPALAWQVLFVFGVWLGALRQRGVPLPRASVLLNCALGVALLLLIALRNDWGSPLPSSEWLDAQTGRWSLEWLRLVNFGLVAWFTALAAKRFPRLFVSRWLAFLGQHSLQVFAFSAVCVYPLRLLRPASLGVQVASGLLLVGGLALPAWLHGRFRAGRTSGRAALLAGEPRA